MKKLSKYRFLLLCLFSIIMTNNISGQNQISGTVTDKNGKAIQGAYISITENPGTTVVSSIDGNFEITGQPGQHIKVTDNDYFLKVIEVTDGKLSITIGADDELITIGFGIKYPKKNMTMAASILSKDKILNSSSERNVENVLYGRIPGLTVLQNGGLPWENNPNLFIRGVSSFQNNSILVLVDGSERSISSISPAEVENIVVLKDAASLSLYGIRGANGVILVTTRLNELNRKGNINIDYESSFTTPFRIPEFSKSYDYAVAHNEALSNDGLAPRYSNYDLEDFRHGNSKYLFPDVNWINETLKNFGTADNFTMSFNGKGETVKYFTMINYRNETGLFRPEDNYDDFSSQIRNSRLNVRTNLDVKLSMTTKLKIRIGGRVENTNQPGNSISSIMNALYNTPSAAYPIKTYNGIWGGSSILSTNPVAQIAATGNRNFHDREIMSNISIDQNLDMIIKGLSFEASYSDNYYSRILDTKTQSYFYQGLNVIRDNSGAVSDTVETNFGTQTNLNFSSNVNEVVRSTSLIGKLKYDKYWQKSSLNASLFFQQDDLIRNSRFNTFRHQNAAGYINYSNRNKYFGTLSVAYSGSNLLPKKNRFGFFPALSIGWMLSDESWFNGGIILDNVKLRASHGMVGSDLVPQNVVVPFRVGISSYYFTSNNSLSSGWREGDLILSNMAFERANKSNLGIDATLFKKLNLEFDGFYEKRSNILVPTVQTISDVIGLPRANKVGGTVQNKGFELTMNFKDSKNDFNYFLIGQFSYSKNKIIENFEPYKPYDYLKTSGKSISQAFGLEAIGFFKDLADITNSPRQVFDIIKPGDIKYRDQNNDGIINEDDVIPIGHNTLSPEIYYSGSFGFEFKGIGIEALLQGVGNFTKLLNSSVYRPLINNSSISSYYADNRWTQATSETATLPRLTITQSSNNYRANSLWLADASYLKVRYVELYYFLPEKIRTHLKMDEIKLYLKGMNLFSFDHIKILDPEATGTTYPTLKSFHLGIKIGF